MLIDYSRDKLANAIIYFAENTKYCKKIKLYKLLYMLDFEHYAEIGRNVTGLEYYAWPNGPVPKDLHNELENPKPDIAEKVKLDLSLMNNGNTTLDITPRQKFDPSHFSRRELRIMKRLADEFKFTLADKMIIETHLENKPWHQIFEVQGRKQDLIPYELALKSQEKELMLEHIRESEEFWNHYRA
ncbi:SocA family protein [bacterium]|nr:SocA family protein [bacterium]